ncbi:uncharacterized protein LOC133382992 [Rhineura floridana]|uniref:uncharacterized protein LOC133382992 n=1 Tax=Rhineura floridana TaxID=261503 RepID=UPI002AC8547C|nr:uncharacterized protein LOC133382992 [Rhineura floridana]
MTPTHSGAPGTDASRAEVSTKGAGATHRPHIREALAYASSLNALPIGGRLLNFGGRWLRLTKVSWIRDLFSYGYTIEFWATPSDRFHPSPCPRAPARHNIMQTAIHHLLDIAAIEPVPTTERSEGVSSLLFAVPKRDLSWRAVLDLKFVNRFVTYHRFKMESLHSITESLHEGDFLASIDLKEAYLHVPICIAHRKFLRFAFGHQHFQYRAMPFGLSSAPRVFTKVLLILVAYLRTQGVHTYPYLDDLLIRAKSEELAHHHPQCFAGLRLACQLRQKSSPTNPTPTTSRGNVGHPAGNGLLGSRSHHCHHKHRKVPDATNIRRRHASRQSARDVYIYNPHCAMGSSPHSAPSMDSVAFSKRHCQLQPSQSSLEPRTAPLLRLVDQGSTPLQGHVVQRTPQNRCNHRCQPHRLGSPLQLPVRSGGLVQHRAIPKHQLAGTKGCPLSSMSFSVSVPFASCAHSNRQHVCKITFEQTGGHQVSSSAGLSLPHLCLGRTTSTIPESRAPQRDLECDSRLAQQTTGLSGRMETSSSHFPSSPVSVRRPISRPVCLQLQLPASQVLCPIPGLNSRSSGCSDNTVARRSIVRLSSHTIVSQNLEEGANRKGTAGSDSTILATPTVVLRSSGNVNDGSLDTSSKARPSIPGSSTAPGPYLVQSNSVAFERGHLRLAGLSDAVIDIILASRRPSTTRIYQHTWVAFSKWCQSHHHDPSQATVHQVLQFLHSGFMMGLRPNTLRRHASTLSSILSVSSPGDHISSHPFIKRFLRGVALRSPAVVHRFPSWSLPKVLQALQRPPFEPIRTVPLRILSFKVLFLIAITSARRVLELGALSSARHLCVFHKDSVVLETDPSFRPKVDCVPLQPGHCFAFLLPESYPSSREGLAFVGCPEGSQDLPV